MEEIHLFVTADRHLADVFDRITPPQWDQRVPEWFQMQTTNGTRPGSLREVANYHAYDEAWIPDTFAGRSMDDVGADRFDGDLLGEDPAASYRQLSDEAIAAVQAIDDPDRTVHFSYGDYPAREALWHVTLFRTMRSHDFARMVGAQDMHLPVPLVEGMWDIVEPHADEWRQYGVLPPSVEVSPDAPLEQRFLALVGREA